MRSDNVVKSSRKTMKRNESAYGRNTEKQSDITKFDTKMDKFFDFNLRFVLPWVTL